MTLKEAQQFASIASQPAYRLFVEWVQVRQEPNGDYSVVIEPISSEQQAHSNLTKANWALVHLMAEAVRSNDRYFTLSEDRVLSECDAGTWAKEWANREKTRETIACSPGIDAEICFCGCSSAIIDMDSEVRPWTASFYDKAANVHHPGPPFKSFERAKAFVDRFIALGCPAFGSIAWLKFLGEFQAG